MIVDKPIKKGNKIISDKYYLCNNTLKKATGVMFRPRMDMPYVFPFEKPARASLHMFFVFFPIDVLFLDSDKKVVEIKESFKPFRLFFPEKKASYVIELENGCIKKNKIRIKDSICF